MLSKSMSKYAWMLASNNSGKHHNIYMAGFCSTVLLP